MRRIPYDICAVLASSLLLVGGRGGSIVVDKRLVSHSPFRSYVRPLFDLGDKIIAQSKLVAQSTRHTHLLVD